MLLPMSTFNETSKIGCLQVMQQILFDVGALTKSDGKIFVAGNVSSRRIHIIGDGRRI